MNLHVPQTTRERLRTQTWHGGQRHMIGLLVAAAVGLLAAGAHALAVEHGFRRFMLAYLVAFAFVLSLSLGALFFVIIQHLTRAGWSVLVRRPAEVLAANVMVVAVLFIPLALSVVRGKGEVYPWAQPLSAASSAVHDEPAHDTESEHHADDHAVTHDAATHHAASLVHAGLPHQALDAKTMAKRSYLNQPFFLVRWVVLLGLWTALGVYFWRRSLAQDHTADVAHTVDMERKAAPAALLFGLTVTLGAFDLLMSINPHWYSTIFGVYYFAGAVVGGLAMLIVLVMVLRRAKLMPIVGEAHFLDLGRLLFGFVFFWGYIAFSQYMLLWYANVPESSGWMKQRGMTTVSGDVNGWSIVVLVLLVGNFLLPFAGLMSRHVKARVGLLTLWSVWLLAMHYLDLLWLVMPEFSTRIHLGAIELGTLAAVACVYLVGVIGLLRRRSMIPVGDPRLGESLGHETMY